MTYIIIVLLIFFTFTTYASHDRNIGNNLKFGPFKTTVVSTGQCESPPMPYEKNPAYMYYCESYESGGKTLLRANFTVVRINPQLKINVRAFVREGDKWKIMYMNKSVGCRTIFMEVLKVAFKIQSSESCIPKGTYTYNDLDFNEIQQKWFKTFMYGRFLWTMQMLSSAGTDVCWQYETDITPILE